MFDFIRYTIRSVRIDGTTDYNTLPETPVDHQAGVRWNFHVVDGQETQATIEVKLTIRGSIYDPSSLEYNTDEIILDTYMGYTFHFVRAKGQQAPLIKIHDSRQETSIVIKGQCDPNTIQTTERTDDTEGKVVFTLLTNY